MPLAPRVPAALLAVSLAACGSDASTAPAVERPLAGWVDVAGMRCADGSATGIAVSPGRSDAVLVYLAGGGACWGDAVCDGSVPRAFGAADYALVQAYASGTLFDQNLPGNPFADWTHVFVPYCTGDVHAGDRVRDHGGETWEHHGWRNLEAAAATITAGLPRPTRLVVAGSSAGGFGALAAYDLLRAEWDPAGGTTAALLDDSGPTLVGTAMPPGLLATWWDTWGLGSTIGADCPSCETDLSAIWPILHGRYGQDRLALVSTTQDATMRGFFAAPDPMSASTFEASLDALVRQRLAALGANVAAYRLGGPSAQAHAPLGQPFYFTTDAGGQASRLLAWLSGMTSLDPAWASSTSP